MEDEHEDAARGNRGAGRVRLTGEDGHVRPLAAVEAEAIRHAVKFYGGNLSEAARRLGIGRSTLYRRMGKGGD